MTTRIAIYSATPIFPYIAEVEWIRRFFKVCHRLDLEPVETVTSDDIIRCNPDCVLVTHEVSPKLTEFPTVGLHWNPPDFVAPAHVRSRSEVAEQHPFGEIGKAILSLDGHICGSRQIAEWMDDFAPAMASGLSSTMASCCRRRRIFGSAGSLPLDPAIMYIGIRWDGSLTARSFAASRGACP